MAAMDKTSVRSLLCSVPPVKALRTEKWRRRAIAGMPSKSDVAAAEQDPAKRRALIEAYRRSDPALAQEERDALAGGCSARTAQEMVWYRLAYGFTFSEFRSYGFPGKKEEERLAFFSDRESVLLSYRLNDLDAMGLFSDKWKTYCRFRPYYRREAVCLASADDFGAFSRFMKAHPVAVAKPAFGSCGTGVRKIDAACGKSLREWFAELSAAGKTILEEPIRQSGATARFHPASVNTVRVITLRGGKGVRLLWAFLKTGRNGSLTDNGAAGGVMAGIDPSDGRVNTSGIDETGRRYERHPDSGESFVGSLLPEWRQLTELCVSLAEMVPRVRMIGWDAAHTEDGWCIVEGNAQSELIGPQAVSGRGLRREIMMILEERRLPTDEYRA